MGDEMGNRETSLRPVPRIIKPELVYTAINAAILAGWLLLYRPVFAYFAIIFTREEFRTSQVVLVGIVLLLGTRLRKSHLRIQTSTPPHLNFPALALMLGASATFLVVERFLNINTLSAVLFGLATYGLVGLWLHPQTWRQGFLAALLLIAVLPFGDHLDTFIGYPVRILTATIVQNGFATAGFPSLGVDTILVFENGVSQVDLPCSGVKSLWTGMLFLLAATWIERRPLNIRWAAVALVFMVLLLGANLVRVAILVAAGPVAGWQLLAEMLHVPLGVVGFVAACAAAVFLLRQQPEHQTSAAEPVETMSAPRRAYAQPIWLGPAAALAMLAMVVLYAPRPLTYPTQSDQSQWIYAPGLATEPLPLTQQEIEWITSGGAEAVERVRFRWNDLQGSMILITSQTWRGQHRPERCFEVYGLSVDQAETQLISSNFPIRAVSLRYTGGTENLAAAYWFQSSTRITDDYATRIWADTSPNRERWVLVTILFDRLQDLQPAEFQAFYSAVQSTIASGLAGGLP
jgi:exosortase O